MIEQGETQRDLTQLTLPRRIATGTIRLHSTRDCSIIRERIRVPVDVMQQKPGWFVPVELTRFLVRRRWPHAD